MILSAGDDWNMNSVNEIRVLIVDDFPQVRDGLSTVIDLVGKKVKPRIVIVGKARNGRDAFDQMKLLNPEVVLMDLEMPVVDGYAATQHIKSTYPSTWVIALTIHNDPASRSKAAQAGVDAFIEKGAPIEELVQAIHMINRPSYY